MQHKTGVYNIQVQTFIFISTSFFKSFTLRMHYVRFITKCSFQYIYCFMHKAKGFEQLNKLSDYSEIYYRCFLELAFYLFSCNRSTEEARIFSKKLKPKFQTGNVASIKRCM